MEVVVADNGSSDGSDAMVAREFPAARFVPTGGNLGFAGGNRVGVEHSRGKTLVFLNNDARVERGWLSALVSALDRAPREVAAVAGRMTSWDGTRVDFRDTLLAFDGHAFQRDWGRPWDEVPNDPPGTERLAASGGNMAIRREAFEDAGGFDTSFFAYLEDVDLGLRLRSRGLATIWEPRAVAAHRSGATGTALGIYNRGYLIEKNALAVVWKNWDEEARRAWLPAVLLTLVHRSERIVRERAVGGERITVDPYRDPEGTAGEDPTRTMGGEPGAPRDWRRRAVRALERALGLTPLREGAGAARLAADPHTLSQWRALHRFAVDLPRLEEARREVDRRRTVPTREILARFPPALVPTYPGDADLFGSPAFEALLPAGWPLVRLTLPQVQAG